MLKEYLDNHKTFTNHDLAETFPSLMDEYLALGVINTLAELGKVSVNVYYTSNNPDCFLGLHPYKPNLPLDADIQPIAIANVLS